ncbi:hypothetical protein ABTA48_19440, partial [Acinetobacter baumannii]
MDERFNGGGQIPTFFIEKLSRRATVATQQRHAANITFPYNNGPQYQAMLINGYAGSGGDLFPYLFR